MSWLSRSLAGVGRHALELEIRGVEHVPEDGPFVLAANHVHRVLDGWVLVTAVGREILFLAAPDVARAAVLRVPGARRFLLPISPALGGLSAAAERAVTHLEAGGVIGVFPEGRSMSSGTFRSGAAALAARAAVPMLPARLRRLGHRSYTVSFGAALPPPGPTVSRASLRTATEDLKQAIFSL